MLLTNDYRSLMVVLYMTAYFQIIANAPSDKINDYILIVHFSMATITPVGNLIRALLNGLNVFSILCEGEPPATASNPGRITIYGGPILYLILQSFFLFGILLLADSNFSFSRFRKSKLAKDVEDTQTREKEVQDEIQRVTTSNDGLRILHLTKSFKEKFRKKSAVAVDDLTLGVMNGEVFALVGPNGAGKSTTLTMIRGEIQPDDARGEIYVDDHSVKKQREVARSHLGVCPQFDAMDQMTVLEHLRFYASVRGVQDVEHNVREVVKAVGLQAFKDRMASKLSGGNKRKLSLGIALIGIPSYAPKHKASLLTQPRQPQSPPPRRTILRHGSSG
jgi:ATP-binding cassette, subfamily A (ABC1), member 3